MTSQLSLCEPQDSLVQDGILFVRIQSTITTMARMPLIALGFVMVLISIPIQNSFGNAKTLDFTIYPDGSTHVFYQIEANPLEPDYSVKLFGQTIDNFFAADENGFLLENNIQGNVALIETFGASTISIDYDTHDIVSKNGKIWSFNVNSPIDYTLLMPKNTVIVGMSTFPLNMETINDQSRISLPKGSVDIDYFFGVSGAVQSASNTIDRATSFIEQIKNNEISTPLADAKLLEATSAYDAGKYTDAETLANEAQSIAIQEQNAVTNAPETNFDNSLILIAGGIAASAIAVTAIAKRKKHTQIQEKTESKPQFTKVEHKPLDRETIFTLKPDLRDDDKELVSFIFENGGQAYESELRKKFLQPRTTMWRAVKRLEREGIVKIEKKELQNLVKITDEFKEDEK